MNSQVNNSAVRAQQQRSTNQYSLYTEFESFEGNLHWESTGKGYDCPICEGGHDRDWCRLGIDDNDEVVITICGRGDRYSTDGWIQYGTAKDGRPKYRKEIESFKKSTRPANNRTWTYTDIEGNELKRARRVDYGDGKTPSRWQEYKVDGKWIKDVSEDVKNQINSQVTVYKYQNVKDAIAKGKTIYIAEGEPAVETLEKIGVTATTNIGGSNQWKEHYGEIFKDANQVVISLDRDRQGVKWALKVAESLEKVGIKPQLLYVYPESELWKPQYIQDSGGADIYDYYEAYPSMNPDDLSKLIYKFKREQLEALLEATSKQNQASPQPQESQQWNYDSVKKHIQNLIDEGFSESQIKLELDKLSKESGFHQISLKDVYWELLEVDKTLSKIKNQNKEIERLERLRAKNLDIDKLLDSKNLTNQLKIKAKRLGVTPESFLVVLLVTAGSLINIDTCLQIIPNDNWKARPILWAVLIALSGRGKSPVIDEITEPLNEFQAELDEKFEKDYENYEKELEEYEDGNRDEKPKEPTYPSVIYNNATTESLVKGLKDNPGKIAFQKLDELDELFKGANQYKGGAGADIQFYLQMTRGKPYKVDRAGKGKPTFIKKAGVSIVGGIQPKVARQTFQGQHADNGFLPRFLPYEIPKGKKDRGDTSVKIDISPLLKSCYERLYFMESKFFTMSSDAWEIYDKWLDWLDNENYKLSDDDGAYASFLSKMGENTASITLVLHCLNAALRGEKPEEKLDAETIKKGIEIAQFFIAQFSILNAGLKSDDLNSSDSAKPQDEIIKLSRDKGWIKAKDCQNSGRAALKGLKPDVIRSLFQELANASKGETRDKETRLQFKAFGDDNHDDSEPEPENEAVGSVGSGSVLVGSSTLPVETNNNGSFENSSSVVGSYPPSSLSHTYQSEKENGDKTQNQSGSSSSSYSSEETLLTYQMAETASQRETEPVVSQAYRKPTDTTINLPIEKNETEPDKPKKQFENEPEFKKSDIAYVLKMQPNNKPKFCKVLETYGSNLKIEDIDSGEIMWVGCEFCDIYGQKTKYEVGQRIYSNDTKDFCEILEVRENGDQIDLEVWFPRYDYRQVINARYRHKNGKLKYTAIPCDWSNDWAIKMLQSSPRQDYCVVPGCEDEFASFDKF